MNLSVEMSDSSDVHRRIFVGNLPTSNLSFHPNLLNNVMSQFGQIENVSCMNGYAIVQFAHINSVNKAMNAKFPLILLDHRLELKFSTTSPLPKGNIGGSLPPPPPPEPLLDINMESRYPVNPGSGSFRGDDNYNASFKGNYAEEAFDENYAENENYPENEYVEDPFPEAIEQKQYLGGPEGHQKDLDFRGSAAQVPGPRSGPSRRPSEDTLRPGFRPRGSAHSNQRFPRESGPRFQNQRPHGHWESPIEPLESGYDEGQSPSPRRYAKEESRLGKPPRNKISETENVVREASPSKNDCEIIATSRSIRNYAERIEAQLQRLGFNVDILFPHEDVPIKSVLDELASRGVQIGIVLLPNNAKDQSLNIHVLQGKPEQFRDVEKEDGIALIESILKKRNRIQERSPFRRRNPVSARIEEADRRSRRDRSPYDHNRAINVSGGRDIPPNVGGDRVVNAAGDGHPHGIQLIMNFLQENRPLTLVEYDKVIKYLLDKRENLIRTEYGEDPARVASLVAPVLPANLVPGATPTNPTVTEIQKRVLKFINSGKVGPNGEYIPPKPAVEAVQSTQASVTDPSIQKALEHLIQNGPNILQSLGQGSTVSAANSLSSTQSSNYQMNMTKTYRQY
ncbi:nuclear receptor coactivator 5-like isoform X2 [Artemia franciscana]|uniref:nuclear receptor coactivator 5-like isoform X2 n=1 Tax=Artemia franciscana TaxID=6661 RepID=UPI0032DA275A